MSPEHVMLCIDIKCNHSQKTVEFLTFDPVSTSKYEEKSRWPNAEYAFLRK